MIIKSTLLIKIIIPLLLIISLTLLLPPFLSPSIPIQSSKETKSLKSFIQCFHNLTNLPNLIFISNTSSYQSTLISSIKNQRFLFSPTASKPSLIISAKSEQHVQAAIICARSSNLNIRPKSGGHDYEGMSCSAPHGTNTSFITIDISALRSISFDDSGGGAAAWVQAGATLGEVYYEIARRNKTAAFPAGFCPTVGIGGHVSGGGIGSLTRKFGTAADNVVDARLVDIKGRILDRKSMGEELFWAIRGAGAAGFGVIVAFKIGLVRVPEKVTVFNVVRTSADQNVTELVGRWQKMADRVDVNLFVRVIAEAEKTGEDGRVSIKVMFSSLYLGRRKELLSMAEQSFPELKLKVSDCEEMSWVESFLFFNGEYGKLSVEAALLNRNVNLKSSFKAKSDFVQELIPESGLDEIWRFLKEAYEDGDWFVLIMEPFGGKMSEISEDEIAFPHRKGNLYNIQYLLKWLDEEGKGKEKEKDLGRMKSLYELMTPYVSSKPRTAYYNYKDIDLGRNMEGKESKYSAAEVWGTKYFKGNFRRLAKVKSNFDPENFFWNEQTIPPLGPAV